MQHREILESTAQDASLEFIDMFGRSRNFKSILPADSNLKVQRFLSFCHTVFNIPGFNED